VALYALPLYTLMLWTGVSLPLSFIACITTSWLWMTPRWWRSLTCYCVCALETCNCLVQISWVSNRSVEFGSNTFAGILKLAKGCHQFAPFALPPFYLPRHQIELGSISRISRARKQDRKTDWLKSWSFRQRIAKALPLCVRQNAETGEEVVLYVNWPRLKKAFIC